MEMKLGGEKVHIKLSWELLTLVTAAVHRFNQMELKSPSKRRKVDSSTKAVFVTSPVGPTLPPWRSG